MNDTSSNEIDLELKKKIDKFFENPQIEVETADFDFIEDMLNKPIYSTVEADRYENTIIELFRKNLNRYPNNIEIVNYSNMLRYEFISTEDIIKNIKNSDEYKRKFAIDDKNTETFLSEQLSDEKKIEIENKNKLEKSNQVIEKLDEYYIKIIKRIYDEELKREADEAGIFNYLKHMKKGMTEQQIRKSIRNSPEYRQNFGVYIEQKLDTRINNHQIENIENISLVYCMMGTNRLNEIKPYIESVLSYVDKLIFIDGKSEDGTIEYLKSLGDKVEVYIYPWQDRFSEQRNHYLEKLRERNYNGFVITSDTDEHYPIESLKQIRDIIPNVESKGFNGIKVQVEDIEVDNDDFNKIISRNINQYWKPLIYKFHSNILYQGEPHETLSGYPIKWYKSNIIYQHKRSKLHILSRSTENFFISNSNRLSEKWGEFRLICTNNGLFTFKEFWNVFKDHKLPKEIEDWIYSHKNDNQDSGDSEVREMYILYNEVLLERAKNQQFVRSIDKKLDANKPEIVVSREDVKRVTLSFIIPSNSIYIDKMSENELITIENRNGETFYRKVNLKE